MSNADNKTIKKSFLTPCRHVGLKRKSLGSTPLSSRPSPLLDSKNETDTPDEKIKVDGSCDTPKRVLSSPITSTQSCSKRLKKSSVRQVLEVKDGEDGSNPGAQTNASEIEKEIDVPANVELETDETRQQIAEELDDIKRFESKLMNVVENGENPGEQTNASETENENDIPADVELEIDRTKQRIAEKLVKVKQLESELMNMKQHDLKTLNALIQKWREGCQLALTELLTEYTNRGKTCTMVTLLQSLGIPLELVHYSEAEMDFIS